MTDDKSLDPSAQYQDLVNQWERSVDKFYNSFMGTDQFSQSMNQLQKMQLEFQKIFKEVTSANLAALNMPSREEVLSLGEQVQAMDARLARIESMLNKLSSAGGGTGRSGPPRTRKPPSKKED